MTLIEHIKGTELEDNLNSEQTTQFESLLKEYFTAVCKENPKLVNVSSPFGIKDVKEHVDALDRNQKPHYSDDYLLAMEDDAVTGFLSVSEKEGILYETHLVVGKEFGGRSIGTELLKSFFTLGKDLGVKEARIYNFTVGGYATFRKVERVLDDPSMRFENISIVSYGD